MTFNKNNKLEKLNLNQFNDFSLTSSSCRSFYGGASVTTCGDETCDLIDSKDQTHYKDGSDSSADNVSGQ